MSDQTLRQQYKTSTNLKNRANLHAKYANRDWFDWVAEELDWNGIHDVIDIGCDAGWFWCSTKGSVPRAVNLTLIDASDHMQKEAYKNVSACDHFQSVASDTADAPALPHPENSFDIAIMMHMMYHVTDPRRAIDEAARVLRPNGRIAITTNDVTNLKSIYEIGCDVFGGAPHDPATTIFGPQDAIKILSDQFKDIQLHEFNDTYTVADAEDIVHYLTSFPPGNQSDADMIENARREITERLDASSGRIVTRRKGTLITATLA